jgi:hypothetical protein
MTSTGADATTATRPAIPRLQVYHDDAATILKDSVATESMTQLSLFGPIVYINLNPEVKEELDKAQRELDKVRFEMMTELSRRKDFGVIAIDNNSNNGNDTTIINDSGLGI